MRISWISIAGIAVASAALTFAQQSPVANWITAGAGGILPEQMEFATPAGRLGVLLTGDEQKLGIGGHEGAKGSRR